MGGIDSPAAPSPMGPPQRPASALNSYKRPGMPITTTPRPVHGIPSTIKGIPSLGVNGARKPAEVRTPASSRRSLSATIPRSSLKPSATLSSTATNTVRSKTTVPARSNTVAKKSAPPASRPGQPQRDSMSPKKQVRPPVSRASRTPSPGLVDDFNEKPVLKSSQAFRRALQETKAFKNLPQEEFSSDFDIEVDPFNHKSRQVDHSALLKRIDTARKDGRLNLSRLDLEHIPDEVLQMYDPSAISASGIAWNETMDLSSFNAADNRLTSLSPEAFPDVDPAEAYQDEDAKVSIFASVERMDIRGNQLLNLPAGFGHLSRLTILNLSRNELGNSVFEILSRLDSLRELHMSDNNINGFLPQSISSLTRLEVLDLSNNRVLSVPESIRSMAGLRVLNVSGNQLTGLPMDALETLPITDLDVSGNALVGALFPFGVTGLKHIQELNVSNNSLASLAFSESVSLPNIRILKISNNRMVSLPDMSGWTELVTVAAGGNKLSMLPQGFVSLKKVRHADFSSNDLTRIDERVSHMNSLESLLVSANPLIDRKHLTMSADAIKRDLRNRVPEPSSQRTSESFEDEAIDVRSPKDMSSPIKLGINGELELSGQGLVDEDADGLRSLLGMHDVRDLQLSRNQFTMIPYELSLAQNLRSLDLSMCDLGFQFLQESLTLTSLQYLQLSGNKISTLEPLMEHLHAPYLRHLDVSNNRLTGVLPALRHAFGHLQELHAADNKIQTVSAESIRGLGTIVLARNDIVQLPAEIGLLWFEGLKVADFSSNAFRMPSHHIMVKGTEATLEWLRNKIPGYAGDDETF